MLEYFAFVGGVMLFRIPGDKAGFEVSNPPPLLYALVHPEDRGEPLVPASMRLAAPELYAALEKAIGWQEHVGEVMPGRGAMPDWLEAAIRAALAKARGDG